VKKVLAFILVFQVFSAIAQNNSEVDELVADSKSDLMVVLGGGLAGAILGLSTLSFVDEPKEHTRNILMGAAIGIIAGVVYVGLTQAGKSTGMIYGEGQEEAMNAKDFSTNSRYAYHDELDKTEFIYSPLSLGYTFSY
jgi:flagellar biosynthesis protein FliR